MSPTIRHLAFATVTLAAIAPAAAQPAPRAPLPPRVGFEAGVGLYGGEINCEDRVHNRCEDVNEAGGIAGHLTYMFGPKLGVTFDVWPMVHRQDNFSLTHTVVTVGATWRPVPILGLTLGLGGADARWKWDTVLGTAEARAEAGGAVLFAAGVDVVRGRSFALAIEARAGIGFYGGDDDNDGEPDVVGRNLGLGAAVTFF